MAMMTSEMGRKGVRPNFALIPFGLAVRVLAKLRSGVARVFRTPDNGDNPPEVFDGQASTIHG